MGSLLTRLKNEDGASFALALLLLAVCVAVSSALLAASSTSMGWTANAAKVDQRYYSVTSASQLFKDSLGPDNEVTYAYTQTRGTEEDGEWAPLTEAPNEAGYDFLTGLTKLIMYGNNKPFESDDWKALEDEGANCKKVEYTLAPSGSLAGHDSLKVKVDGRVKWGSVSADQRYCTLDLDFYNNDTDAAEELERSYVHMSLAGDFQVTEYQDTRKANITWRLQQITPGKGI